MALTLKKRGYGEDDILITSFKQYIKAATLLSTGSEWIKIITFGIYENEDINQFLSTHTEKDIEIIVSYHFSECSPNCEHCKLKIENMKRRYNELVKKYPDIIFKFITAAHAKLLITQNGALIGGMNFSGSGWDDFVIQIQNNNPYYDELLSFFNRICDDKTVLKSFDKNASLILTFGKYKGRSVKEVAEINPNYLRWAEDNIEGFKENYELKGGIV